MSEDFIICETIDILILGPESLSFAKQILLPSSFFQTNTTGNSFFT